MTRPSSFADLKKRLAEAAYITARYDMADEKGETRRQRNARFGAEAPEPDVPDQAVHVFEWFWELSSRRRTGPEAITYGDLDAWARLTGQSLLPLEVEWLMAMDGAYLRAVREDQDAARQRALDETRNR